MSDERVGDGETAMTDSAEAPGVSAVPHVPQIPVVARVEAALAALGADGPPVFDRRPQGERAWFADWAGDVLGSDVYIGLGSWAPDGETVQLLLDDWTLEPVASTDAAALLTAALSGRGRITDRRTLLVLRDQLLEIPVGDSVHSAARPATEYAELSPWERRLYTPGAR
ncbi:hypothetical protein [Streptomyces sp. NPDC014894]|uniref:hypothetical protein n=1 Tax=Streptomyces sp. NPDC014894 TaxID=3364931 RepID=UPI0036FA48C6